MDPDKSAWTLPIFFLDSIKRGSKIAIVGPACTGKTYLAMEIVNLFKGGTIIDDNFSNIDNFSKKDCLPCSSLLEIFQELPPLQYSLRQGFDYIFIHNSPSFSPRFRDYISNFREQGVLHRGKNASQYRFFVLQKN